MLRLSAIKIPNIIKPTVGDVYVIDGEYMSLEDSLIIYSAAGPGERPIVIEKKLEELSLEQVARILKRSNIPYQEVLNLDDALPKEIREKCSEHNYNLQSLIVALLFMVEFDESLYFAPIWGTLDCLPSYNIDNAQIISPEFLKAVLLSASRINFYYLQLLSVPYDIIWNDISQNQDFASLFTRKEAAQIYEKVFIQKSRRNSIVVTPGWMRLFCMVEEPDAVYKRLLTQVEKIEVNPFSLCKIRKDVETYGCEKMILRLLHEKKPKILMTEKFPRSMHPDMSKPLENSDLIKTLAPLSIIRYMEELEDWFRRRSVTFWRFSEMKRFAMKPETFESLVANLKTLIKDYFSSSPFMVLLFYAIPYITLNPPYEEEFGKVFFHHFNSFLLSLPDTLLKKQTFRKFSYFSKPVLIMLALAKPDMNLVEPLIERCRKIKGFPLEIFLFHPEIRKYKDYNRLVLKIARSGKRIISYIEMFEMIKHEKEFACLSPLLEEYKIIYSDVKQSIPMDVVEEVLQKKYVIDGVEDKVKILVITSKTDKIKFKRYLMLKEVGLQKGDVPDVVDAMFKMHGVSDLRSFVRFVGKSARKMDDKELEIFAEMLSWFVGIMGRVQVASGNSKLFLKDLNIDYAISIIRKVKEAAEKESQ